MKHKTAAPSQAELVRSIDVLFRCAHESALFVYWKIIEKQMDVHLDVHSMYDAKALLGNGFLEASLLLTRKSTEFFKPKGANDKPDSLYAYQYLPDWKGTWIVDKESTYQALHTHIGHITVHEARSGKRVWRVVDITADVLEHWITFFTDVRTSAIFGTDPPIEKLDSYILSLREVLRGCRALQRRQLKRGQ